MKKIIHRSPWSSFALLGLSLFQSPLSYTQVGVGINTSGAAPAANTMLDVTTQAASAAYYGIRVDNNAFVVRGDGNVGIGVAAPVSQLNVYGKTTLSRDNAAECCGNDATLALAESTSSSGRLSSISFHNGGSAEGSLALTQAPVPGLGLSARRISLFDYQNQGMGLQITGGLFYGNDNS